MKKSIFLLLILLPHFSNCSTDALKKISQKVTQTAPLIGHTTLIGLSSVLGYIGLRTAHVFTGTITRTVAPTLPLLALYPIIQHSYWLYQKVYQPVVPHNTPLATTTKKI